MHPSRRRKKRPNYGIRTVEVLRGPNGFGFTISGQQPCILSCIVANSPADLAGLRAGDFLISVNGISVSKSAHDAVVSLIGNCIAPIKMTIAENYYSDSSEEELDVNRLINARKPKHMHKPRAHRPHKQPEGPKKAEPEEEAGPIEYKALVGYLGTIEMPKQLLPNSRLQTVCSCIRKLRQEKRAPTAVLMTIFPTCLTLKNSSNHILAIYPTNRVVYIGSTADRESRYFGLVTSAVCDARFEPWAEEKKCNNSELEISNSCHVFMIDPKIVEHSVHLKKAESFKIHCTSDLIGGCCLEFPRNALYIVNLVQSMYKLQAVELGAKNDELVANSPQPSASSNSDSGIGFRDDCGNVSDRILVVEFPAQRPFAGISGMCASNVRNGRNRPVDVSNALLEEIENSPNIELNNIRCKNSLDIKLPNNLSKTERNAKQLNNLNNIRACGSVNIKNVLEKADNLLAKQNNEPEAVVNRLNCRALPASPSSLVSSDDNTRTADVDTGLIYSERPVDVPEGLIDAESDVVLMDGDFSSGKPIFKTPSAHFFASKKVKKGRAKMTNSCDNLDKLEDNLMKYKLSPKVYGLSKPNHSCEELAYGSLQELSGWNEPRKMKFIAQSEPDVRVIHQRVDSECEENGKNENGGGAAGWALSFEKLLDDPLGLHTFAEFLKKEISAENIYFWTACERYRKLASAQDRLAEAGRIYQQHLEHGAQEGVNVDAHGLKYTKQCLPNAEPHLFDLAQKQIFNLMKFDSYPRFLKSDLYKQCLVVGASERPVQYDAGLMVQPASSLQKLKKSLSNAEDMCRKSLLPWHRKNRSKSKDRGESDYKKKCEVNSSNENVCNSNEKLLVGSDVHSSKSSLTSLDLAISLNQGSQDELQAAGRPPLCRVLLSNGSTTVVQIKGAETIEVMIRRLLDKRGIHYSAFEVITNKHPKPIDIKEASQELSGCEVGVEQRVIFKLDLPNKKVYSVKAKYTKIIGDVLRPILSKYNYNLDNAKVTTIGETENVDLCLPVTTIDEKRLVVTYNCSENLNSVPGYPIILVDEVKVSKLDEITNQVFEGIRVEKAKAIFLKPTSDKGSVQSEDWGSEHSSGRIGRFLRRDSGMNERKKKQALQSKKSEENLATNGDQVKKPLIAKLKNGVNKFQVAACSESDELVEGLTRAQRSRLEDQRGTEINSELPDFLKENNRKDEASSRFYLGNYEPVRPKDPSLSNNNSSSINQNHLINGCSSAGESLVTNSTMISREIGDPPPLPPKPKIVPKKPNNWRHHGVFKKDLPANEAAKSSYLEHPSSSFV